MQSHSWSIQSYTSGLSTVELAKAYDNSFGDTSTAATLVSVGGASSTPLIASKFVTYKCSTSLTDMSAISLKLRRTYSVPAQPEDSISIEPPLYEPTYYASIGGIINVFYSWDNLTYVLAHQIIGGASSVVQSTVTNETITISNFTEATNLNTLYIRITANSGIRSEQYLDGEDMWGNPIIRTAHEYYSSTHTVYDIGLEITAATLPATMSTSVTLLDVDNTYNGQNTYKYLITNTLPIVANNTPAEYVIENKVAQAGSPIYSAPTLCSYSDTVTSAETVIKSYEITTSGPIEIVPSAQLTVNSSPVTVTPELAKVLVTHPDWQHLNPIVFEYESSPEKPWCLNYFNPSTLSYIQYNTITRAPRLVNTAANTLSGRNLGYFKGFRSIARYWPDTGPSAAYDEQGATPVYPNEHTAYSTSFDDTHAATYTFDGQALNPSYTNPSASATTWTFTDNLTVTNPFLKLIYSGSATTSSSSWDSYEIYPGGLWLPAGSISGAAYIVWEYSTDSGTSWKSISVEGFTDTGTLSSPQSLIRNKSTQRILLPGSFNLNTLQIRLQLISQVGVVTGYNGVETVYLEGAGGSSSANVFAIYIEG